jgi:hypothetical protein
VAQACGNKRLACCNVIRCTLNGHEPLFFFRSGWLFDGFEDVPVTCSSVARAIYTNTVTGTLIDSKRSVCRVVGAVGYVNEFGQVGGGTVICSKWKMTIGYFALCLDID